MRVLIKEDGSVDSVGVLRRCNSILSKEAIRVCQLLPKFIPAKYLDKPVCFWFTIPLTFSLSEDKKRKSKRNSDQAH